MRRLSIDLEPETQAKGALCYTSLTSKLKGGVIPAEYLSAIVRRACCERSQVRRKDGLSLEWT